jgi:hypothetical protein
LWSLASVGSSHNRLTSAEDCVAVRNFDGKLIMESVMASSRRAMKTAAKEKPKLLDCLDGAAPSETSQFNQVGWKQEKLRPSGRRCFLLTSPSIEHFHSRGGDDDGCEYLSLLKLFSE